jgi:hypothetical protein
MKVLPIMIFLAVWICGPATSYASESTIILGLHTVDGDDYFANKLSTALREQSARIPNWQVSSKEVSLSQISLAYGCEEFGVSCMATIAKELKTSTIIYGIVRRTSALKEYEFGITLDVFNAETGAIENSVVDTFPSNIDVNSDEFRSKVLRLLQRLARVQKPQGTIVVTSNQAAFEVLLDRVPIGRTTNGKLVVEKVALGNHDIEVIEKGYSPYKESVVVVEDQKTYVQGVINLSTNETAPSPQNPEEPSGGRSLDWLGWTLVGVSGASLIGAIVSWTWIDSINNDPTYKEYRKLVGARTPAVTDVCKEVNRFPYFQSETGGTPEEKAKLKRVQDMCYQGDILEIVQWIFVGTAAAAATGAAVYFIVSRNDDSESKNATQNKTSPFVLRPLIKRESAFLSIAFNF